MERKKIVGYEYARNLMRQLDRKLRVTITASATRGLNVDHIEIYHPKQDHSYTVRRDSGKRLMQECYKNFAGKAHSFRGGMNGAEINDMMLREKQ